MVFEGKLEAIFSAVRRRESLRELPSAELQSGEGLIGDRYSKSVRGRAPKADQEVTLIEAEAVEAMARDYQIELAPHETRRNLLTRGVPLNHLVGQDFRIGDRVVLRGVELCEPCSHLEKLTLPGIERALQHRGGLRAQIVVGGTIHKGDLIRLADG